MLVDDHTLVLQGLHALLSAEPDIVVVGEAKDGRQATEAVRELHPDVVVMDVVMPRLDGLEASRRILEASPATRVLILSGHCDDEYIERAMELGASGYVLKDSSCDDLARAILTVWSGKSFFSAAIARSAQRLDLDARGAPHIHPPSSLHGLTPREVDVLQFVAEGRANKEAAAQLGISIKTVEKHRSRLMQKLDIHDVAGLTRYAIAIGVIEGRKRWVFD